MNALKKIVGLVLTIAAALPVQAQEIAQPLPEVALQTCWGTVVVVALVVGVLGFVGLLVATAQKVDLHNGMGDVYMSVPLALACWLGLAGAAFIGHRGDDLLPYMQPEMWLAVGLFVFSLLLSFILVKRCNPDSGFFGLLFAAFGRLFVDILSQLLSLLTLLGGIWVIFGGRKQDGEKVSFLGRLGCAVVFAWMFNLVWGSIRTTTRESVSASNGYLLGVLNVLCVAAFVYGGYEYVTRMAELPPSALVAAVRAGDREQTLQIIADNPMMERGPAIEVALREKNRAMLNLIIRNDSDLALAMQHAETHGLSAMADFLREKCEVAPVPQLVEE